MRLLFSLLATAGMTASGVIPALGQFTGSVGGADRDEAGVVLDFADQLETFDPANFDDPLRIDNPWLPLRPGTQFVYAGVTQEAGLPLPHRLVITVTDMTKVIAGVETRVVWDQDFSNDDMFRIEIDDADDADDAADDDADDLLLADDLVEAEISFFAQDNDGNVWRLGEYPEVYEDGRLTEVPAWIEGYQGARAGIIMLADPMVESRDYSQGWGPAVNFTDRGLVDGINEQTCVPVGCLEDVVVIAEYSREEPDAFQLKYYSPNIGNVRVGWRGLDATRETLQLIEVRQLTPEELAHAHIEVLALEQRAYLNSREVYGLTAPIQ